MKREGLESVKDLDLQKDSIMPDEILAFNRGFTGDDEEEILMIIDSKKWFDRIGLEGYQKGYVLLKASACHCCSDGIETESFSKIYFTEKQLISYFQRELVTSKNEFRKRFYTEFLNDLGEELHLF